MEAQGFRIWSGVIRAVNSSDKVESSLNEWELLRWVKSGGTLQACPGEPSRSDLSLLLT